MRAETFDISLLRRLAEVAVAGSAVVAWRGFNDAFGMPKLTLLVLSAIGIGAVGLWRVLSTGNVAIPKSPVAILLGAFLAVGLVAVVTSDSTWRSVYGAYGRACGFALYLACGLILLAVVRSVTAETAPRVVRVVLVGAVAVAGYALVQRLGIDPIDWPSRYGDNAAESTLGNANFVSGYLGSVLPLATWAVWSAQGRGRLAAGVVAVLTAAAILATRSEQGILAAAVGLGALALVVITEFGGERRRTLLGIVALAGVAGSVVVGMGLAGSGPLTRLNDAGYQYRRYYWSAAIEMARDHPVAGVGFDRWGAHYRSVRSPEAAESAFTEISDEPHSVPLNMFASGGVPLGVAYATFVGATGVVLVQGLRRLGGAARIFLAAVGASWLAYQVQSAVSIDLPPLAALHFALAGLIVVLAGEARPWVVRVPFLVESVERRSKSGKTATSSYRPRLASGFAATIAGALAVLALWQASRPMRADWATQQARDELAAGDVASGSGHLRSAFHLAPWEPEYLSLFGSALGASQQAQLAQRYFEGALEKDNRRFADTLNAARAADVAGDLTSARRHYERALELEPNAAELRVEVAEYLAPLDPAAALPHAKRATELNADSLIAWQVLGDVQQALGHEEAAAEAYRRAVSFLVENDYNPWLELGRRLRQVGELDEARELVEHVLDLSPSDVATREELARIEEASGNVSAALALFEGLERQRPGEYSDDIERLRGSSDGAHP